MEHPRTIEPPDPGPHPGRLAPARPGAAPFANDAAPLSDPATRATLIASLVGVLARRRILAACILVAYVLFTITAHDVAQAVTFWLQDLVEPARWLRGVAMGAAAVALAAAAWLIQRLRRHPDAIVIAVYGAITLALASAAYATLVMVANECIHFVQYALLAVLVFPFVGRLGTTVVACTIIGALDEGYQYVVLHAHWGTYFDFNDVILNLLGAGFGVIALRAALPPAPRLPLAAVLSRPDVRVTGVFLAAVGVSALAGLVRILPDQNTVGLVLRRGGPSAADWLVTNLGKRFHELQPAEAGFLIIALWIFYFAFDIIPTRRASSPIAAGRASSPATAQRPDFPQSATPRSRLSPATDSRPPLTSPADQPAPAPTATLHSSEPHAPSPTASTT